MASCSTRSSPLWPSDWLGEPSPAPWISCHGGTWTKSTRHLRDTSATSAHKRQALSQGRHALAHTHSTPELDALSQQEKNLSDIPQISVPQSQTSLYSDAVNFKPDNLSTHS